MRPSLRSRLATLFRVVVVSMLLGAIIGPLVGMTAAKLLLVPAVLQGMLTGATIAAWCGSFDLILLPQPRLHLDRQPFSVHILAKTVWFTIGIVGAMVLYGALFAPIYGLPVVALPDYAGWMTLVSLAVAFTISFVVSISRLLGPQVFVSFILGRYHRPREETRIFLFADLVGSTETAERIGPLAFHALLSDFVADEVIVTWTLQAGVADARCLTCQFAMREALAARAAHYKARYGLVPDFHAALHCGPVVLGEMGVVRQAIVVLGDTVNTTARIEQACRELGEPFLVSAEMLGHLALPAGYSARSLGQQRLRGKSAPIEVFAVTRP